MLAHHNSVIAELAHNNGSKESDFPLALHRLMQTGQQIGALGVDPHTGKPDIKRTRCTKAERHASWEKATPIPGKDEHKVRQDVVGAEIHWEDYGKDTVSQS